MQQNPYAAPSVDPVASPVRLDRVPREWTIGSVLGAAWGAFKANALLLIIGLILMGICLYGIMAAFMFSIMPTGIFTPGAQPDPAELQETFAHMGLIMTAMVLVILPLEAFLFAGWIRMCLSALRNEDVNLGILFSGGKRILPILVAMIAVYFITIIGMVLLIIPGIIASLGLALVLPLLADGEMGVRDALSESWESMKGHKLHLFGFGLVAFVIYMGVGLLTFNLGLLVVLPLLSLAGCEIYQCVTGRHAADA